MDHPCIKSSNIMYRCIFYSDIIRIITQEISGHKHSSYYLMHKNKHINDTGFKFKFHNDWERMKRKITLPPDWPEIPIFYGKCGILRKLKAFKDFWVRLWNVLGVYDFIKMMFLRNIVTTLYLTGIHLGSWYSGLDFV